MTDISALLIGALDATGTKMGDAGIAVIVGELKNHPPADVRTALSRCARESHGFLTLSDILERIPRAANHVPTNPDEAWTMAVSLVGQASEASTIVAPEAILAAFPHALWNQGDEVAARMSFKAGLSGCAVAKHRQPLGSLRWPRQQPAVTPRSSKPSGMVAYLPSAVVRCCRICRMRRSPARRSRHWRVWHDERLHHPERRSEPTAAGIPARRGPGRGSARPAVIRQEPSLARGGVAGVADSPGDGQRPRRGPARRPRAATIRARRSRTGERWQLNAPSRVS